MFTSDSCKKPFPRFSTTGRFQSIWRCCHNWDTCVYSPQPSHWLPWLRYLETFLNYEATLSNFVSSFNDHLVEGFPTLELGKYVNASFNVTYQKKKKKSYTWELLNFLSNKLNKLRYFFLERDGGYGFGRNPGKLRSDRIERASATNVSRNVGHANDFAYSRARAHHARYTIYHNLCDPRYSALGCHGNGQGRIFEERSGQKTFVYPVPWTASSHSDR